MKKLYLLVLSIVFYNISFSAPIITAIANGNWNTRSTWNLNRLPCVGDTIFIPANKTVIINDDENFNGFVYIKIFGKLYFENENSTLSIADPSVIIVYPGAQISGSGSASQKIRYNNSIIFKGNDTPITGPEWATAASSGFDPFSTLPVKFIGFTVTCKDADVLIQWSTSQEINASMYEVERSLDGNSWTTIAYVAVLGSLNINSYSYTDKNLCAKIAHYRIKEVDFDGQTMLTSVKSIKTDNASAIADIKIGSIQNKVLLQFPQEIKGNVTVRFISPGGQVVDQQNIKNPVGQIVLNSKLTGNYIISISNGQNINTARPVIL